MKLCDFCDKRGKQYKGGHWVCADHYIAVQRGEELEVRDDAPDTGEPDAPAPDEPDAPAPDEPEATAEADED